MKKLLFIFIFLPILTLSQEWIDMMQNSDQNFYQTQNAFNDFWEDKTIEKGKGWKQFKRWENFIEQRVYPDGILQPQILFEENQSLKSRNNNFPMLCKTAFIFHWKGVSFTDAGIEYSNNLKEHLEQREN